MRSQPDEPPPSVFLRPIETPPGFPWDQQRAAELEAQAGSPVTDPMVQITVKRQGPWRPNRPGRFQAIYARPSPKVIQPFHSAPPDRWMADWLIDGEGRLVYWAAPLGAGMFAALALIAAAVFANQQAAAETAALAAAEARLAALSEDVAGAAQAVRTAQILDAAGLSGSEIDQLIADLAWTSRSRSPEAVIREVVWRNGQTVVTTDDDALPFASEDRVVEQVAGESGRPAWRVGPATDQEPPVLALEAPAEADAGVAE